MNGKQGDTIMMRIMLLLLLIIIPMQAKDAMNFYGMVLAGGVGERLWPLSRSDNPKQFLSIDAHKTLLEQSIERLSACIMPEHCWLVIAQCHQHKVDKSLPIGSVLIEPVGRNTGPAILYACLTVYKQDPNAVVIFVPADAYIPLADYDLFARYVRQALTFASQHDVIGLLGVKPTYPALGYGYIEYDMNVTVDNVYKVARFHEKPSEKQAASYIQMPHMLWNIGMFVGKASVFIEEYKRVIPQLYAEVIAWQEGKKTYDHITNISIDYAVMERSNRIWVLPVDFAWCDVGNIEVYLRMKQKVQKNDTVVIAVDAHNNLVDVPRKMVALVGVDDLCIVETADALLITKRKEAEKVRAVVAQLKKENHHSYL